MTREEMIRILSFVDATRELAQDRTRLSATDPRWNIISYAMRRHLEGKMLTITSLASAADVPYGTAMRRIGDLIDQGFLIKRSRSKSGKSFSLHPTRKLIGEFESFAMQFKAMVGNTFGFTNHEGGMQNFYFGGSYMASRILPYPSAMRAGIGYERTFRILSPIDPTFKTLSEFSSNLDELCGTKIEIVNLPLDELHDEIIANGELTESKYDLMAVDLPWIGELAEEGVVEPISEIITETRYSSSDFHNAAWRGSSWRGVQYGLPIQPTAEVLFCREDLFAKADLTIPVTTQDVLFAARMLHRSAFNLSGIVMNFGRGTPVAHTFIQTLADFGQPIINLKPLGDEFDVSELSGENYRPILDTAAARDTAEYLMELLQFAHPESMKCNWDRRIRIFSEGHAAMTYGWSIRAAAFEKDESSPAHGHVACVPHPSAPGQRRVSPIGGFSLAIPSGLTDRRKQAAWKVMEYLTRPELMKWYVQNGNLTSPRFSTSADPEVQAASKLIGEIDGMERRGEIQIWPRPPIPEFSDMLSIIGDEIHGMLQGDLSVGLALANTQARIDQLMRQNGRY
ncbi:MAG: extracellular solute-binding protein [Paracoccaceae bacterium]|nr:extracellular solute-binding protein [Paracoccaceae bacterium]